MNRASTSKLMVLLCVSVPSFMINLDANIVAVSLPSIARSLHADFASIEWVVSAYTLTFAALVLPAGMLADRYGRKSILLAGLALFTLASLFCGAAPNVLVLNSARALQGIGAALLLSAALAILSYEFRGAERPKAFAFWGSVIGIAMTLGPIVGGLITRYLGWEWAFYVNLPVGVIMIALTMYAVTDSRSPGAAPVDIPGLITFAGALFLVTLALISGNREGWTHPSILAEFFVAIVLFSAFLTIEARSRHPMLELSFFKNPTYIGANVAGLAYAACLLTMLTYLPLYFQGGLGVEPQTAGFLMLPMAVPLFLVPRVTAVYLTHRLSGRALLTIGLLIVASGLAWIAAFATRLDYGTILVGMLLAGIGAGLLNGETAKVGISVIPPDRAGMAAGVGGTVRFAGIVVGFAALGAVLFDRVRSLIEATAPDLSASALTGRTQSVVSGTSGVAEAANFAAGYQTMFLTAAATALIAAIATWVLVRSSDTQPMRLAGIAEPVAIMD